MRNACCTDPGTAAGTAEISADSDNPSSIVFDGTCIWIGCEDSLGNKQVLKLNAGTGTLVDTLALGSSNPNCLAFDGVNVWVGTGGNKLQKL